jgi:hypothetical protein
LEAVTLLSEFELHCVPLRQLIMDFPYKGLCELLVEVFTSLEKLALVSVEAKGRLEGLNRLNMEHSLRFKDAWKAPYLLTLVARERGAAVCRLACGGHTRTRGAQPLRHSHMACPSRGQHGDNAFDGCTGDGREGGFKQSGGGHSGAML